MRGRLLFVVAVLASAFLIFLVQPMVGKRILPWFGGTPSVWTICLAFYQTTLFIGYVYAHVLTRFAPPAFQLGIHAIVVGAALVALPVLPGEAWQPIDVANPSVDIIAMLVSNVTLPFLVLASTGPLVQAWFARGYPDRSPYPLYAVSNVGSFAALLAYPFVFEPRLPLSTTGALWSYAFVAAAALVLGCAVVARNARAGPNVASITDSIEQGQRLPAGHVALWVLLAGCAVSLLMGVTNLVSLDVASVPFLWILPLATYLLTFILCFSSERSYRPVPYLVIAIIAFSLTLGHAFVFDQVLPFFGLSIDAAIGSYVRSVFVQIPAYCSLLFAVSMILHGELYGLRPPPRDLTAFYLCVSGGGALGGLFVGLLAPVLFEDYYEVRVGLVLAVILFIASRALGTAEAMRQRVRGRRLAVVVSIGVALTISALWLPWESDRKGVIHQERSFFGLLRVRDAGSGENAWRGLESGSTLHGVQYFNRKTKLFPTSYYGRATGIGLALAGRDEAQASRIGLIGLGVGTLAAYGRADDYFRAYEIDPAVVYVARDSGYFTYLEESAAPVDVILGDARLVLAKEQRTGARQAFDFLVLDAFNSDAIPVHLLTLEAFRLYANALSENGVLAVHVSNRHFNLAPLVARAGFEVGLDSIFIQTPPAPRYQSVVSQWVLLTANSGFLEEFADLARSRFEDMDLQTEQLRVRRVRRRGVKNVALWSDDYSDLLGALRPKTLRPRSVTPAVQNP